MLTRMKGGFLVGHCRDQTNTQNKEPDLTVVPCCNDLRQCIM